MDHLLILLCSLLGILLEVSGSVACAWLFFLATMILQGLGFTGAVRRELNQLWDGFDMCSDAFSRTEACKMNGQVLHLVSNIQNYFTSSDPHPDISF